MLTDLLKRLNANLPKGIRVRLLYRNYEPFSLQALRGKDVVAEVNVWGAASMSQKKRHAAFYIYERGLMERLASAL